MTVASTSQNAEKGQRKKQSTSTSLIDHFSQLQLYSFSFRFTAFISLDIRAVSDHCGAYGFLAVTVREGGQVQKLGQEISIRVIPSMPSSLAYRPVLLKSESTTWPPGLRTRTISRMASRRSSRVDTL